MPQNRTITVTAGQWTQITDANVTEITFVNQGGLPILVNATVDGNPPSEIDGMKFPSREGVASMEISKMFPGVPAAARVWVWARQAQDVFVSHA